jgi:hypothetical protein
MSEEQITLFDVDNQPIEIKFRSKYQKWKYENNYGKADKLSDIRCENCKNLFVQLGKYYKCNLLGTSCCAATDIRLSCVCKNFEMEEEK